MQAYLALVYGVGGVKIHRIFLRLDCHFAGSMKMHHVLGRVEPD